MTVLLLQGQVQDMELSSNRFNFPGFVHVKITRIASFQFVLGSVGQVLGRWKVNQPTLAILCKEAQRLIQNFSEFSVRHVDRVCSPLSGRSSIIDFVKHSNAFTLESNGSMRFTFCFIINSSQILTLSQMY